MKKPKVIHEFATQWFENGVWKPIRPRWTEQPKVVRAEIAFGNRLNFQENKAIKMRVVHRTVTEPVEIGKPFVSGAEFKADQICAAALDAMKRAKGER